jgi:tripartite-type tricarboxylate transporter receptor subunit TctC
VASRGIHSRVMATLLTALSLLPFAARGENYPDRPVRLVLGFAPGTGSDLLGRVLTQRLSQQTGGTFLPDNRPGAGGLVATKHVIDAEPDGYTLLLGTNATLIVAPALSATPPYDVNKDLVPISMIARSSMVLVTSSAPSAPKSLPELLAVLRKGSANFSSAGVGTIGHLASELMQAAAGVKALHVPYRGSSESLTDIMRGNATFAVDTVAAVLPFVISGSLRALAVTGEHRLSSLPDVPTFTEAGLAGADIYAWWGVMAPARTPPNITAKLEDEIEKALQSPEMATSLQTLGIEPFIQRGKDFGDFIRAESERLDAIIQNSGLRSQ